MTPIALLGERPDDHVLFHEIGHFYIGEKLGFSGLIFQFMRKQPNQTEIARVWYNPRGVSIESAILYSLSGMYNQAIHSPESIYPEVGRMILNSPQFLVPTAESVINEGFGEDVSKIWSHAGQYSSSEKKQLTLIQKAHHQVQSFFSSPHSHTVVCLLFNDLRAWLETDDPDFVLGYPHIIYPKDRGIAIIHSNDVT